MELQKGLVYNVVHSRKGSFQVLLLSSTNEWFTGKIVTGIAKAVLEDNVKYEGEEVTMRKSL